MKKIISLFMALGMVLSLAACSTNQSPSESTPDERDIALVKSTVENWDEYDTIFIGYPKMEYSL